ncbi:hypothetical protein LR48_Vigan635s009500 [Vigna angularis]|uniref:Uncharacterized protein n=1 Tax=Phaseolus angularis TaxID=3914 RepID=A0A0L9TEW7_PHAAN|nr:hypothetical protein LR48_Vigan635s009500 [Vigna angularis]
MEEMECGHYVGHGYVSNWGMQCENIRRRRCTSNAPPSTVVSGYTKYLNRIESEMKRQWCVGKDNSYETEINGSLRKIPWLTKKKYGTMTHNC